MKGKLHSFVWMIESKNHVISCQKMLGHEASHLKILWRYLYALRRGYLVVEMSNKCGFITATLFMGDFLWKRNGRCGIQQD